MNVSKQVKVIQAFQSRYAKLQKDIQERIRKITKPVEVYLRKRFKEEFPGADFHFLPSFQCGCLTNKWQPQVFLYRVSGLSYSPDGYWYDEMADKFEKHSPPVPTRRLLAFLKMLTEEVGIKVTLVRHKPYWLNEEKESHTQKSTQEHAEKTEICLGQR